MLSADDYAFMKSWFDQGVSISEIARQTGYDRKTVKKYVSSQTMPVHKKRAERASKLDAYREYITERLQMSPLSAKRMYDEILEMGFEGKYSIVKDFLRKVKRKSGVL
jgi:transposase